MIGKTYRKKPQNLGNVLIVCWALRQVSLSGLPPENTRQPALHLFSTGGLEPALCFHLCHTTQVTHQSLHIQKNDLLCDKAKPRQTVNHADLPRGSHTRTASTRHCGRCCGTTWRGPRRLRTWPCSWDMAAVLFPGMHNLKHKQLRSSAASCCLHLYRNTFQ